MSVEPKFTDAKPVEIRQFPLVLRFKGLWPHNLARFKFHDERRGGDLEHIDEGLTKYNEVLVGEPDWDRLIREEIAEMRLRNLEEHVGALKKKSRQSQARKIEEAGPVDPWRTCEEGPLREGILTVSKDWFGGSGREQWDPERVAEFKRTALKFLVGKFSKRQLRYASVHLDEEALHIHFVIATWTEKLSINRGRQFLLQPSVNPLIANYEHAQNVAGAAFAEIGIVRGQRHAEARRKAREEGKPLPKKRRHTPPSKWREEERRKAQEEKVRILAESKEQGKEIVEGSRGLSTAAVKKLRKRMIKDAKARKRRAEVEEAKMIRCRDAARAEGQNV